jgi:N-acetylmuramic acid 6-phosphate etherase
MQTENASTTYRLLDTWSLEETLAAIVESNARAVQAVQQALPALSQAAEGLERCLRQGGRLIYVGAGTSGRLASQDAAELRPTFGFERTLVLIAGGNTATTKALEDAEDDRAAAVKAVAEAELSEKDAVLGIAASGRTPFTVEAMRQARDQGAFTIGLANNPDTPLLILAEVGIFLDTGPEVLAGSTRLAAGTAQKIVLNALSTSVLVRLGGAYQNFMVGMKPQNQKLRERAVLMVSQAANVDLERARAALESTNWRIREAIVMLLTGQALREAEVLLERHGNRVREAVAETKLSVNDKP